MGYQGAQRCLEVTEHRCVGDDVLVEFGRVNVAMNDFGMGGEIGDAAGNAVIESGAQRR